jgi:predicted metal-dependent hydrolase
MNLSFEYGTTTITFDLIYKKRKTLEIGIEPPDKIYVVAPIDTPEDIVLEKVKSRANWIIKKLFSFRDMEYRHINREFVNGESFMYLGRNYSLQIIKNEEVKSPEIKIYRGKFYATTPTTDEEIIKKAMEKWYREKTLIKVETKVKYYEPLLNKKPNGIRAKEQKKRWASCTSKNELYFNWRCIMAPSPILDYIVLHEMCHMFYKNHSREFWNLVGTVMPDYPSRKEWLKNYGVRMDL